MPSKKRKNLGKGKKAKKRQGRDKERSKSQSWKFCQLSVSVQSLKGVIWHQEQQLGNTWLATNILGSFVFCWQDSGQETAWVASNDIFWQNFPSEWTNGEGEQNNSGRHSLIYALNWIYIFKKLFSVEKVTEGEKIQEMIVKGWAER